MEAKKFKVNVRTAPGCHLVALSGELDLSTADMLRRQTEPLAADTGASLTLDLQELVYIDSTGIGVIVGLLKIRQAAGLGIQVQHVPAKIRRLFDMTGLTRFLTFLAGESGGGGTVEAAREGVPPADRKEDGR
ncbi:STAS domain-containing protein [Paenibacillus filicis]|uniref:Anti-sigma factor antagonist n=1 Tax=Paenibacillus filicis TaxID=669464 RepID=A0ABU9DPY9_9BACL